MAQQDAQDRQLPASQRRLDRARREGQVPRSRDLGHALAGGAGVALLAAAAPASADGLRALLAAALRFDAHMLAQPSSMLERLSALAQATVPMLVLMGLAMALVAVAAAQASGGWVWTFKPMAPQFAKFNPLTGLARLVSRQQLADTFKTCLLALALGGVAALYLRAHLDDFAGSLALPLEEGLRRVAADLHGGLWLMVGVLVLAAAVDWPLQRFLHRSRLKMSHRELKDEHKEVEGNAEVKAKLKQRMREITRRRMLAAVPQADLVVMNPTHYAVALKYDEASMAAPRIVAKGADLLAMKIRDIAREAKVPVLQAAPLARALYAHGEVDREVPLALFSAVAQVLAYVYQLRAALVGRAPQPGELPEIAVPAELDPHQAGPEAAAGAPA